jgi:ribonuclease P/MRP protein subunit RPP1
VHRNRRLFRVVMYFDLNVPIPLPSASLAGTQPNKGKGKQVQSSLSTLFTPAQLAAIETRIDLLVHCSFVSSHYIQ